MEAAVPQGGHQERSILRRKGILALALVATLIVGVSSALAARKISTEIVWLGNNGPTMDDQTFFGDLKTNAKCRGARTVGLFKKTLSGSYRLIDIDLSSFNGAWALRADVTNSPDLAVQVKREKRGQAVCKASTLLLTPPTTQSGNYAPAG